MGVISFLDGLGTGSEVTGITFWSAETTKKYVEEQIDGQKFKTINGESIKGEGDIEIIVPDLNDYYTKEEVDETFMKKGEIPEDVATQDWVNEQGFLKEHQDISGKADKTYVDGEIERVEGLIPSVEGLASEEYVNNAVEAEKQRSEGAYAKKEDIPSLDGYATEDWVNEQGFLKEHQDISGKADKTYVDGEIERVEGLIPSVEGLASETYVDEAVEAEKQRSEAAYMKKGEMPTDVYTKDETDEAISEAITIETARTESTYAKKSEIPVVPENVATTDDIDTAISNQKFKTVNGETIVGEGDIEVESNVPTFNINIITVSSNNFSIDEDESLQALRDFIDENPDKDFKVIAHFLNNFEYPMDIYKKSDWGTENWFLTLYGMDNLTGLLCSISKTSHSAIRHTYVHQGTVNQYVNVKNIGGQTIKGTGNIPLKTINGNDIIGEGNIVIQGGGGEGGETVIELTQEEYDALEEYAENTTYIITDAEGVNMYDFQTVADMENYYTKEVIDTELAKKANAANISAKASGYQFPNWTAQGIITGSAGTVYSARRDINGTSYTVLSPSSGTQTATFAPTSAGSKDQVLLSNGSGAPVWSNYKFQFISQSAYEALATKDETTIYFIISED